MSWLAKAHSFPANRADSCYSLSESTADYSAGMPTLISSSLWGYITNYPFNMMYIFNNVLFVKTCPFIINLKYLTEGVSFKGGKPSNRCCALCSGHVPPWPPLRRGGFSVWFNLFFYSSEKQTVWADVGAQRSRLRWRINDFASSPSSCLRIILF